MGLRKFKLIAEAVILAFILGILFPIVLSYLGGGRMEKKVVIVIAPQNFRDEEALETIRAMERHGIKYTIASLSRGECKGMLGAKLNAERTLEEIRPEDYDGIIFIGGAGTPTVRASNTAVKLAREFYEQGKLVAAICWAPTILAKAGVLKGKHATVWVGFDPEYNKTTPEVLESYGAVFEDKPVVVDGRVVTANGPLAAISFGETIARLLREE